MRVAVIGGGVAGLSAAARLAPHAEVTVFEAEAHLGYHTSGRSAAMFEENYGNAAVRALNRASKEWFDAAGVLSPRGIMMVALGAEIPLFETDLAGMGMKEIALVEARARVPILSFPTSSSRHGSVVSYFQSSGIENIRLQNGPGAAYVELRVSDLRVWP